MKRTRYAILVALPAALLGGALAPGLSRAVSEPSDRTAEVVYLGPVHVPGGHPLLSAGNASRGVQFVTQTAYDQNGVLLFGGGAELAPGAMTSASQFPVAPDTVLWGIVQGEGSSVFGSIEVRANLDEAPTRHLLGPAVVLGGDRTAGIGGPVYRLGAGRGIYVNVANVGAQTQSIRVRLIGGGGAVLDSLVLTVDPMHISTWTPDTSGLEVDYYVRITVDPTATVIATMEEYSLGTGMTEVVHQIS